MSACIAAPRRGRRGRRGAALVFALAALVLLMALALALHAVTLRAQRSARRAALVRTAMDGAEGALARWQARLARGEPAEAFAGLADGGAVGAAIPGSVRELEGAGGAGEGGPGDAGGVGTAGGVLPAQVRVTLVTFADGLRLLVSDGSAGAGALQARRRVSLLLVPDTLPALPRDSATGATAGDGAADTAAHAERGARPRLVPAPERAWAELP